MKSNVEIDAAEKALLLTTARRRVWLRVVLLALVIAVAAFALRSVGPGVRYYFAGGDLKKVGDVRMLRAGGQKTLDLAAGSFVALDDLMVLHPAEGSRHSFFYCPLYSIVVRTPQKLPQPVGRVAEITIPEGLEYLLEQRLVLPENFESRMDVAGWLMPLRDMPGFSGPVGEYARKELKLTDEQIDASWALLDGEPPASRIWDVGALVGAFVVLAVAAAGLAVASRALARAKA